jgi:hypothetical protein
MKQTKYTFLSPSRGTSSGPSGWPISGAVLRLLKLADLLSISPAQLSCPVNMSVLDT